MAFTFSPELCAALQQILTEQRAQSPNPTPLTHNAVYVLGDMNADYYLTLDGEVLWQDDEHPLGIATNPYEIYGTLIIAAQRFNLPELQTYVPPRPANGVVCPDCHGTHYLLPGALLCSTCAAKGWVESSRP